MPKGPMTKPGNEQATKAKDFKSAIKRLFSELENYKQNDYYENHKKYTIYTESDKLEVEIVAIYIADASKESLPINFEDNEREKYLKKVMKNNILDSKVNIESEDKLITLCTCADVYDTSRLVLIGKVL